MRKLLILITSVVALHFCKAQNNFTPCTIVYPNKDTVRGWVDYKNWDKNPKKIAFRTTQTGNSTNLSPLNILSFSVLNDYYVAKITTLDKSPTLVEALTTNTKPTLVQDTVFLSASIKGNISLYSLKDERSKTHYFIEKGNALEELISYRYVSEENTQRAIKNKPIYKATLATFFQNDCATITSSEITQTAFDYASLFALVQKYNTCVGSNNQFEKKKEKGKFELGVMAGVVKNRLVVDYDGTIIFFKGAPTVSWGLFSNYTFPRNQGKFALHNEVLFKSYRFGRIGSFKETAGTIDFRGDAQFSYFQLYTMLRYQQPSHHNIHFFGDVGVFNGSVVGGKNFPIFSKYVKYELGVAIDAGVTYKHFSALYRFATGSGMIRNVSIGATTQSSFLMLGYTF